MTNIKKVVFKIDSLLCFVACVAVFCCMLLVTAHVFMRIIVNSPIAGLTDYVGLITVVFIVMSIPWIEKEKGHIKVDFVKEYLPVKTQRVIFTIVEFISNAVIIVVVWRLILYSMNCFKVGSMTYVVYIPFWPFVVLAAIGMFFFFLTSVVNYISEISSWARKGESI